MLLEDLKACTFSITVWSYKPVLKDFIKVFFLQIWESYLDIGIHTLLNINKIKLKKEPVPYIIISFQTMNLLLHMQ